MVTISTWMGTNPCHLSHVAVKVAAYSGGGGGLFHELQ